MNSENDHSKFRLVFKNPHVVLPVIHVTTGEQAVRNMRIAFKAGADGVFLIGHAVSSGRLLDIHSQLAGDFSGKWIGVNLLGLSPEEVFAQINDRISGVWTDNAMIEEDEEDSPVAGNILAAKAKSGWKGLYFGGVAFKYQRPVQNLAQAACRASRYMDVVTTSGPGTGQAADVAKIRAMKDALGDFPLAIASGITPENVSEYLPCSDCYLVATGISSNFEELSPAKARALIDRVRSYDAGQAPASLMAT